MPLRAMVMIEALEQRALMSAPLVPQQIEYLNRGIIAVNKSATSMYVSWRLLAYDAGTTAFNLYRSTNGAPAVKLNGAAITNTTDYSDNTVSAGNTYAYHVKPVINGVEQAASEAYSIVGGSAFKQSISVPLQIPPGGNSPGVADGDPAAHAYTYTANDASVGDVDGDGEYEIILKWEPTDAKDNSQDGYTGNVFIDAYKLNGTRLWRIDLGRNIRAGAHYTQFMVYDLDGDGKSEVAMKTAPGTIDGLGNPVLMGSDSVAADYRNTSGYILTGPEYLTVFNGLTGANMATVAYTPDRVNVSQWGDGYGNRVDRFTAGIAYLDGQRPSLIMGRGYYGASSGSGQSRNEITAWDFRNGTLTRRWWFKAARNINSNINSNYIGQGIHGMMISDVDGDGKDEIVYGASTINDDGNGLYSTGLGHGDAMMVADMDPSRPGTEVFQVHEGTGSNGNIGASYRTGNTGVSVSQTPVVQNSDGSWPDVGRGNAFDIDPRYPGFEYWSTVGGNIYNVDGTIVQPKPSNMHQNFAIWWDADPLRETMDNTTIGDWKFSGGDGFRSNYDLDLSNSNSSTAPGASANNGTKSTPNLVVDLFGDWREEAIWRRSDNTALDIYTTTISATNRLPTLMHDVHYRESVAWQNVAYNQPTSTSYFLGAVDANSTASKAPQPNVYAVRTGQANISVPVSISGQVFEDMNDDGVKSAAEPRLNSAVVYIDANGNAAMDAGEYAVATDAQGYFIFSGLANGTYTLRTSLGGLISPNSASVTYAGVAQHIADLPMQRISFDGIAAADNFLVRKNVAGKFEVLRNNVLISTLSSSIPSLAFDGLDGSDTLIVDGVNGTPIPAGGLSFNGGVAGTEAITIKGTSGGDTVIFNGGTVTLNGLPITYTGGESITYNTQGGADTVTVNSGLAVALPDASVQSLTINSGGTATINAATSGGISARTINTLVVNSNGTLNVPASASATYRTVLVTTNLTVNGKIDLTTNDMIVKAGNAATVHAKVGSGANFAASGYWNGATGILSSNAAGDATLTRAVGVMLNDNGAGGVVYSTFAGQSVTAADVLLKYTMLGDANLDGQANTLDFTRLAQNFNASAMIWGQGDFNFDGKVNALDFNALASKWGVIAPGDVPVLGGIVSSAAIPVASAPLSAPKLFSDVAVQSTLSVLDDERDYEFL